MIDSEEHFVCEWSTSDGLDIILQVETKQKIKSQSHGVATASPKIIISSGHHWPTIPKNFFIQNDIV